MAKVSITTDDGELVSLLCDADNALPTKLTHLSQADLGLTIFDAIETARSIECEAEKGKQ